jgi:hypothetical protein
MIQTSQDKVIKTWWGEWNQTANKHVARIRTDIGPTFGPLMKLSANVALLVEDVQAEKMMIISIYLSLRHIFLSTFLSPSYKLFSPIVLV